MWKLDKWYQKVVYVFGWIWVVMFAIGFFAGLVAGMIEGNEWQ